MCCLQARGAADPCFLKALGPPSSSQSVSSPSPAWERQLNPPSTDWEEYLEPIPVAERGDMVKAYYARLTGSDEIVRAAAGRAWVRSFPALSTFL